MTDHPPLMWCSFADDERGFLGAAFLYASDPVLASMQAHLLGCNPGGQLLCVEIDPECPDYETASKNTGRLFSLPELCAMFGEIVRAGDGKPVVLQ